MTDGAADVTSVICTEAAVEAGKPAGAADTEAGRAADDTAGAALAAATAGNCDAALDGSMSAVLKGGVTAAWNGATCAAPGTAPINSGALVVCSDGEVRCVSADRPAAAAGCCADG